MIRFTPAGKVIAVGSGTASVELKIGEDSRRITFKVSEPLKTMAYVNANGTKTLKYYNVKPGKAIWFSGEKDLAAHVKNGKYKTNERYTLIGVSLIVRTGHFSVSF
ncbi:MAG: hypothetical protein IJU50_03895 [Lachnospiraceae bacterium]|nr:hypothetical protein [Lachnospiraceae bacterium]